MPDRDPLELKENRTEHDVGEIFRLFGQDYERRYPLTSTQRKTLRALAVCRTAYLGGHIEKCDHCDFERPHYNSCRNVNCPKCQGIERRKWVNARFCKLLPVPYFHVVFTLPSSISDALIGIDETVYRVLFRASSQTLLHFFKTKLGGEPGLISVLHTWGQTMSRHPHTHFIVTGGCLSFDSKRWIPTHSEYLFDVTELSREFQKRFLQGLKKAGIDVAGRIEIDKNWVVHCRKPFAGAERVIEYLGRYVYRTAISNRRIQAISAGDVTFDYKDYRDEDENGIPRHKSMRVGGVKFIRLFFQHVLPSRFRRIRYYGVLAGRYRSEKLERCQELLGVSGQEVASKAETGDIDGWTICPQCGHGELWPIELLDTIRPPPIIFANERIKDYVA